jgi:pilus assembly protein CpaF
MDHAPTQSPNNDNRGAAATSRHELQTRVHQRLLATLDLNEARRLPTEQLYSECSRRVDALLSSQGTPLSTPEKRDLLRRVMDDVFGLGPIEEFLRDPSVTDILINGPHSVYVERHGVLEATRASFRDEAHLINVMQRIAAKVGRRIDESSPMLDARLTDGSRVNAIIPPLALDGPAMSIRRFGASPINIETLLQLRSLTEEMAQFLQAAVHARLNVLISGGTGSGKTTMLNVLSRWIPDSDRVITIEDAAELQLQRNHVVRLETRPPNIESRGEVTQRDLLRNSLRMRPDHIIIGEVRSAEALDMLQAMNTGHDGSMTTVHANSTRDALSRIENMVSMAGLQYPVTVIRQQMASAIHLVIHVSRLTGGKRRLVSICEVTGMEGDIICLQDIFGFRQTGVGGDGHAVGVFECRGVRPRVLDRILEQGGRLPNKLFERRALLHVDGRG